MSKIKKLEPATRFMTMGELAMRYYDSSKEAARKRLHRMLTRRNLWGKMRNCGYDDDVFNIPPRVVKMLDEEFLGEDSADPP